MNDAWNKEYCEKCDARNWICLGDLDDLTKADVEGYTCWKCNHKQLLSDISVHDLMDWNGYETEEEALDKAYYDEGLKDPDDFNSTYYGLNRKNMVYTRIAPSPTGYFHIGTARTAYFNWLMARATKGKFILRIDDTDIQRNDDKYIDTILSSLKWLNLDYDEIYYQSKRLQHYKNFADDLVEEGLATRDGELVRFKPKNIPDSWHDEIGGDIKITKNDKDLIDNMVLIKSNGIAAYNFASVVDDLTMDIDAVIRGTDHITNTSRQVALLTAFNDIGYGSNIKFYHVGLIHKDKKKLSKRDGGSNLLDYQTDYLPDAMLNFLLKMGWNLPDPNIDKKMPLITQQDAINLFLQGKMRSASANFDQYKLDWYNKQYGKRTVK